MTTAPKTGWLLRFAETALAAGLPDAERFMMAVSALDGGASGNLETLLGLRRQRGERDESTTAALNSRDAIIRDVRTRLFVVGLDPFTNKRSIRYFKKHQADLELANCSDAAEALHKALIRYRASGWKKDRAEPEYPRKREETLRAVCWAILKASDKLPAARTVRRIMAARSEDFMAANQSQYVSAITEDSDAA